MKGHILLLFFCLLFSGYARGQADSNKWLPAPAPHFSFIRYDDNVITKHSRLDSFFYKLAVLKHTHSGTVNIIHIGDSHLQADGITSVVRNGLQDFFGDAGRGLVFPYQLANSNAPRDIASSSNVTWKNNRLTSPDKPVKTGLAGYGIQASGRNAVLRLKLKETDGKQARFNRMVFFLCNDSVCYRITDSNIFSAVSFNTGSSQLSAAKVVNSDSFLTGFELSKVAPDADADHSFYGVSLEKRDVPGVLYHTIGVNGARFDQFLQSDLFWSQLRALQGDLFIVSLGTNEAQNQFINEQALIAVCDSFVRKVHTIAPHAMVLFTTPAGSYFREKKPNKSIHSVSEAIRKFCETRDVPCWDLFHITGGLAATPFWKKFGLISHDLVHYNNAGYQLQGALLLNAMAKEYNSYEKLHPFRALRKPDPKAKVVVPPNKTVKEEVVRATIIPTPVKTAGERKPQAPPPDKPVPVPPPPVTTNPNSHIKVEYGE